jgi:hypothetical protein
LESSSWQIVDRKYAALKRVTQNFKRTYGSRQVIETEGGNNSEAAVSLQHRGRGDLPKVQPKS